MNTKPTNINLKKAAFALGILLAPLAANAQIVNGSFEDPTLTFTDGLSHYTGSLGTLPSNALSGWVLGPSVASGETQTAVGVYNSFGGVQPHSGTQFIEIEGMGTLSQAVTLAAGQYTLNLFSQGLPLTFQFSGSNITFGGASALPSTDLGAWITYTSDVFTVATAGTYTLSITGTIPTLNGSSLVDDVSLSAVPEPSAMLLLGAAGLAAVLYRKRFHRVS